MPLLGDRERANTMRDMLRMSVFIQIQQVFFFSLKSIYVRAI